VNGSVGIANKRQAQVSKSGKAPQKQRGGCRYRITRGKWLLEVYGILEAAEMRLEEADGKNARRKLFCLNES
jgi:hypothetical protein